MNSLILASGDSSGRIKDAFWACSGLSSTSYIDRVDANSKICRPCLTSLETATIFQQLCQKANEMLHDQFPAVVVEVASSPESHRTGAVVGIEPLPAKPEPMVVTLSESEETDDATSGEEDPHLEPKKQCPCHLCAKKPQKPMIPCEVKGCHKKFTSQAAYDQHINSHDNFLLCEVTNLDPVACKKCTDRFRTKKQLKDHIDKYHNTFKCKANNCGKKFPTYYKMKLHMQASH
jgi:Zinc finger, C2H2 type